MPPDVPTRRGRLFAGTSGFAYRAWIGPFYPPGIPAGRLLASYADRLPACELNGTFYRQPSPSAIAAWVAATPPSFRFSVKAHRAASFRAFARGGDPAGDLGWLTAPLGGFGERLGAVLFRIPAEVAWDGGRLDALLDAWPAGLPLVVEAQDASWHRDETFASLRRHGAVLCATDLDDEEAEPDLRLTGSFLYLRLRRAEYSPAALDAWAGRIEPFLAAGHDAFVFFRHDDGQAPGRALALLDRLGRDSGPGGASGASAAGGATGAGDLPGGPQSPA